MTHELVKDAASLAALAARVATAPRVALDTEFHTEKSYASHLMVVQLAFDTDDGGHVAIVDPLALRDLTPLAQALTSTLVVGHALQSDLKILHDTWGVLPAAVFDTQVAAAFVGYGLSISLADLVREFARVSLRKSQTVSDWSTRPLTAKQIDYLVDDVRYLFTLHDGLVARLEERGRLAWARDECAALADPSRYEPDPRRLYLRIPGNARMNRRELGVLRELAILRDQVARERDVPLKYVMPDDVIAGLATLRPKSVDDLAQLRRIDNGMRRHLGAQIVAAVERADALPEDDLPPRPARGLPPQRDALVGILGVIVASIAAENDIPAALLAPRAALERLVREYPQSFEEFVDALDLAAWRRDLVAEPLWAFVQGRARLGISGYAQGVPRAVIAEE